MSNNPWIIHVKKYAKDNNIAYGCAVSEAKASYVKQNKPKKIPAKQNKADLVDLLRSLDGVAMVKLFTPTKRKSSYDLAGDREYAIGKILERYNTTADHATLIKRIENYKKKN